MSGIELLLEYLTKYFPVWLLSSSRWESASSPCCSVTLSAKYPEPEKPRIECGSEPSRTPYALPVRFTFLHAVVIFDIEVSSGIPGRQSTRGLTDGRDVIFIALSSCLLMLAQRVIGVE